MPHLATLVAGSAAALALAADAPAMAGSAPAAPLRALTLICDAPAGSDLCRHLGEALGATFPAWRVEPADAQSAGPSSDRIRFASEARDAARVAGHLSWRLRDGQAGRGPTLELMALDTALTPVLLRDYAHELIRQSDLPL